jgi:GNAT superfamily N-acetyltransferase
VTASGQDSLSCVIRRGGAQDVPFMRDMLHHAYYWRETRFEAEDVPVARYIEGWGRRGDDAVVAVEGPSRVGAAWHRLFSSRAPGFGFVDESIPELTIAVVPSRRGRGTGGLLLSALVERARRAGYAALSLSVEDQEPKVAFYERHGFRKVEKAGEAWKMRLDLAA